MDSSLVEKVANAVLYEGYILYPYRPSAVKNQQRWNFGALCPQPYSLAQGGTEAWSMQTECLAQARPRSVLDVKVRFLHLLSREVGVPIADCPWPISDFGAEPTLNASDFQIVPALENNGRLLQTWQEAVERDVAMPGFEVASALTQPQELEFIFPASERIEPLRDESNGAVTGIIIRRQESVAGRISVTTQEVGEGLFKITARIFNQTTLEDAKLKSRDDALMRSFVSTHTILSVHNGEFVSLLDPPESCRAAAAKCDNVGTYPILVGDEGERNCMLSSPIILYDYPQIAPESAGDLFDGTEIDEILTLRIMTLTDEEKREMRGADERARQILERTETLPVEQLMKMHGAMKGVNRKP